MEHIHNILTVPCEKSKMVSFSSSKMKTIIVLSFTFSPQFRFPVKLIYCIAFGSASISCCVLKSIASNL